MDFSSQRSTTQDPPRMLGRAVCRVTRHRGMTLVELLIVVTIILVMLAVAVPALAPSIRENRIREGSRQVNVMIARAKARAGELGRRVALWLERSAPGSNAVMDVYLAEAPPEYSGDIQGARCELYFNPAPAVRKWQLVFSASTAGSLLTTSGTALVLPGENFKIRFDGRGGWYDGYRDRASGVYYLLPPLAVRTPLGTAPDRFNPPIGFYDPGIDGGWGFDSADDDGNGLIDDAREAGYPSSDDVAIGLAFQIQLIPRRVSSSRLQLPEGTIVDLGYSGMGISMPIIRSTATANQLYLGMDFHYGNSGNTVIDMTSNASPVLILFEPTGEVNSVIFNGTTYEAAAPIHLLIGLFDQTIPQDSGPNTPNPLPWSSADTTTQFVYNQNISDLTTIWVSIGDRTGSVSTTENGWELVGTPANFYESFRRSREFAQRSQTIGGR